MTRPTLRALPSGVKTEIPVSPGWIDPLSAYLDWMRSARKSDGTIYQHSYQLRRFARATGAEPSTTTLEQLAGYMASLDALGASARRTARQALRGFYAWGELVRGWDNPARHLPAIKAPRGVARPAPEHSVRVGLSTSEHRVRLMIRLAVNAGLRCREICQVHTDDVVRDLVGWSLIVHGKGDKQRQVPLPDALAHDLLEHAAGYIFPGQIDGHLSPSRVSELISEALPPGVTAHQLRHRYGTRAYNLGGKDLRAVQELLGHAYISTTQIYVGVEDDAIRRAASAAAGF
ncbi:tyrosine-type recombinase/integrase [Microbacterium sp. 69-10]|uniref:tyrosine-type recombinase/integrase n=1 Tax=Microbacterium sp. 69-10 TaxID=1895783 RepID=UPI000A9D5BC7|nr:tyrosine-type recombinase/integrase [Microbacterium sp. 69-10]